MLTQAGKLIISALFAVMLGISPASALLIGAGQSATFDFDFSASQPAIDASSQPLTLSFTMTTSALDPFDDPAGLFAFEYLDIGAVPVVNFGYDATGGVTSLGLLAISVTTTDLVGSLRISTLTESIDLVGLTFGAQDFNGIQIIPTTSLSLPNAVDVQIPEPGTLAVLGLGLACLGYSIRRRAV
jgi:hypothetical protein